MFQGSLDHFRSSPHESIPKQRVNVLIVVQAPTIVSVTAADESIFVAFTLVCPTVQQTTVSSHCSTGVTITGAVVTVSSSGISNTVVTSFSSWSCANSASNAGIVCLMRVAGLQNYQAYSGSMVLTYTGATTESGSAAFDPYLPTLPYVTMPWATSNMLNTLYSVTNPTIAADMTIAIYAVSPTNVLQSDTNLYLAAQRLPVQTPGQFILAGDGIDPNQPLDGEAALDLQVVASTAVGANTMFFTSAASWTDMFDAFSQLQPLPTVFSISYSEAEYYDTDDYPSANNVIMMLNSMGTTVVSASGDNGIQGNYGPYDTPVCPVQNVPVFPATSPHVLAVGGTQLYLPNDRLCTSTIPFQPLNGPLDTGINMRVKAGCSSQVSEVVCSCNVGGGITSGGGISTIFSTPQYQQQSLQTYVALNSTLTVLPSASFFNAGGRAYPDIAAIAANYLIYQGGVAGNTGGTSASTPFIASLVLLLNAARTQAGLGPMGWIHPWLYRVASIAPSAFTDIIYGNNDCGEELCCTGQGFASAPGFDIVTGLGSPLFDKLLWFALHPNATSLCTSSWKRSSAICLLMFWFVPRC
eukprot:TRINITY_DN5757_c0_g1_i4.p1 TRINITY_DN5757_c0_g1~~TRINITY_DN5757_c0_g1_i4.p1  ORF type:complete len:582 (+),score=88.91 TRINITY_DN5757_c0_g1_i4:529-2274(+)